MWVSSVWRATLSPGRRAHSALAQLRGIVEGELEGIRGAGTWKSERVITSRQGPCIHVDGISGGILNFCANNYLGLSSHPEVIQAGVQALEEFGAGLSSTRFICGTQIMSCPFLRPQFLWANCINFLRLITEISETALQGCDSWAAGILNFCANNYLGLSSHPEVIQAGVQALEEFGAGLSSTRFICGTQSIHKNLEAKIAHFHQREDAILYPSCFDANAGLFEALLTPEDAVLSDELNHASIIDGIRLCKAHKYRYSHLDMADLEAKLKEAQKHRLRLVATDGAFSMDGDIAPLQEICSLAARYGALVFVDECHATGFLGPTGRGTDELLGVMDQVTIINSTLGKALGGASGGYTTGPEPLISLLRQRSRPYLFSNSLPPAVVGCASKALDLLMENNAIIQSIAAKTRRLQLPVTFSCVPRFRSKMEAAGFTISGVDHPICPVMLGDARLSSQMADDMLKKGIFVIGFNYPVVPKGKARIRVQISAVHSEEDIDRCVEAFVEVGRLHGALP
ncbi:2-amino-3-ketobutyrate coenzyme A ligase, mitochondrial [Cricetulus griseus]|uniref:2-amino-3-ketobutyrate coenzyme A ligase, mitochondrial n=1 Tax=Cricetulus griseus TaxID=10029 RepID=G3I502_CRIGR|nr:2-amino-3-ketobutyrate coenzyme A ligase, mitochondrial [Cricetulus griseus]